MDSHSGPARSGEDLAWLAAPGRRSGPDHELRAGWLNGLIKDSPAAWVSREARARPERGPAELSDPDEASGFARSPLNDERFPLFAVRVLRSGSVLHPLRSAKGTPCRGADQFLDQFDDAPW